MNMIAVRDRREREANKIEECLKRGEGGKRKKLCPDIRPGLSETKRTEEP